MFTFKFLVLELGSSCPKSIVENELDFFVDLVHVKSLVYVFMVYAFVSKSRKAVMSDFISRQE